MNVEIRNNLTPSLIKSYLEDEKKNSPSSNCYMGNSKWIFFYEWSNVNSKPRIFFTILQFVRFLRESKIEYTKEQLRFMRDKRYLYAACKYGIPKLEMSDMFSELKKIIS